MAAVSFISYLITGFVQSWLIALPIAIVMMLAVLFIIRGVSGKKEA